MRAAALVLAALVAASCSFGNSSGAGSNATPAAPDQLDTPVAIPSSFPSDVPVYPGARPVKVTYHSNGQTVWEVAWETLDGLSDVQAFYAAQLSQGDWATSSEMASATQYTSTFSHIVGVTWSGLLTIDTTSKVAITKISIVLTNSG